jgi:hypothetical protein
MLTFLLHGFKFNHYNELIRVLTHVLQVTHWVKLKNPVRLLLNVSKSTSIQPLLHSNYYLAGREL